MAITSLDQYIAAPRQRVSIMKTATRTSIGAFPFSIFDLAGNPSAGALAIGNTANGVVPTDATAGYPLINAFQGGAVGYIGKIDFGSNTGSRLHLYDCLFSAGAYAFNANTNLASQPSFAGRVLGGTDYTNTELWVEQVTAATGNQAVNVTYVNQSGTGGKSTGAVGIGGAPTVGRLWQLPLATGDTGIQQITNITGSVATAGTFNVHVMRRLWSGRIAGNFADTHDFLKTGLPQIFDNSALRVLVQPDSTSTGVFEIVVEVVNG